MDYLINYSWRWVTDIWRSLLLSAGIVYLFQRWNLKLGVDILTTDHDVANYLNQFDLLVLHFSNKSELCIIY